MRSTINLLWINIYLVFVLEQVYHHPITTSYVSVSTDTLGGELISKSGLNLLLTVIKATRGSAWRAWGTRVSRFTKSTRITMHCSFKQVDIRFSITKGGFEMSKKVAVPVGQSGIICVA